MVRRWSPRWLFVNQVVVFNVCGDAEAWIFDGAALAPAERDALVRTHLAAFSDQLRSRGVDLFEAFEPFALLGTSMPAPVLGATDLSAPHEGTFLRKKKNDAIFYVAASDDLRGYVVAANAGEIAFREAGTRVQGPVTHGGAPTVRTGFTLEQYALVGNMPAWVLSKHTGVIGLFERMFGKG